MGIRLVASLIVRNELGRYLKPCVRSLSEYCDEIRVLDDASSDGTSAWLGTQEKVRLKINYGPSFFDNEGQARNILLDWTLEAEPTHILAIDADEFLSDGKRVRQILDAGLARVWTLKMEEVWKADTDSLWIRNDGGWRAHEIPCLWEVPEQMGSDWRITDRALACGREPEAVRHQFRRAQSTGESILHFGWTNESAREARYQRYVTHDGGEFHANQHIQSIMYPDDRVRLQGRLWPGSLIGLQAELLERVTAQAS